MEDLNVALVFVEDLLREKYPDVTFDVHSDICFSGIRIDSD